MFDDEKIRMIEAMPEADMVLVIWVKLLTLAGRKNMNGYIFLTENIPYTDEMLSTLFNRPLNTVRLALSTFKKFSMVDYEDNGFIKITNWEKHQNIDALEKIREQNRLRVQRFRENQKQISSPKDCNVTETFSNDAEENRLEKNIKNNIGNANNVTSDINNIIDYLNKKVDKEYRYVESHKKHIRARLNEGFTINDFKSVIDIKVAEWKETDFEKYLRPKTLFGTKFDDYLNQKTNHHEPEREFVDLRKEMNL